MIRHLQGGAFFCYNKQVSKKNLFKILLGSAVLAFGISQIHSRTIISEGGELGMELLLYHWFSLSPAFTSILFDVFFYSLAFFRYGKGYFKRAIFATVCYSGFYYLMEGKRLFIDLSSSLLLSAIIGALFVGIGCGLVISAGGACGSDDVITRLLSDHFSLSIGKSYILSDAFVLVLSISYIPLWAICFSLLSCTLSSALIDHLFHIQK